MFTLKGFVHLFCPSLSPNVRLYLRTLTPRFSAPAYNIIPRIEHTNFDLKKYFHSCLYVGKSKNLNLEHNFDQSLEMRFSGV